MINWNLPKADDLIFLYNGALMDEDGDTDEFRIPHLFHSVSEAQVWIDSRELEYRVVAGTRVGDRLIPKAVR